VTSDGLLSKSKASGVVLEISRGPFTAGTIEVVGGEVEGGN